MDQLAPATLFAHRCFASLSLDDIAVSRNKNSYVIGAHAYVKPTALVTLNTNARITIGTKLINGEQWSEKACMRYSRKIESDDGYHQQEQPEGWEGVNSNLRMQSCSSDHLSITFKGTHPEHSVTPGPFNMNRYDG